MEILIALLIAALVMIAPLIAAVISFLRIRALRGEVDGLRARIGRLEARAEGEARGAREERAAAPVARVPPPPPRVDPVAPPVRPAPVRPVPVQPAAHEPALPESEPPDSLEARIGGRWLLNVGIAAIVIGVAYFEKLAIDNNWISETARVIQGGVFGALLVAAGGWFVRRGYRTYGQMITGGGVAVMYVSIYAAFNYYRLIDRPAAFVMLVAVSALGAWLADRHASQGLAIFAVGGGFVTPFLLPGNTDAQVALFTYDAILIAGTVFLAGRRDWPFLHVVSYLFTLITIAAWADRFYNPSTYAHYVRTELFFTLFCGMFVAIALRCRGEDAPAARFAALLLWTAPAAYYLASLVVLSWHAVPFLVWLICVMLAGAVLAVRRAPWIGLAVWTAVAVPLLGWTQAYGGLEWLTPGLAAIAGIYTIALAAQLRIMDGSRPIGPAEIAWLHGNGLVMFAAAYLLLEETHLAVTGPLAAVFAVWQGVLAASLPGRSRDHALHFAGLAFSLLTVAVALQYDGPAVTVAWAAEGAALVALGLQERRDWLRAAGAALLGIAVVRALELLVTPPPANYAVILSPRAASTAFVVALCYVTAWLHWRYADRRGRDAGIGAGLLVAQFVTVALLTHEIRAFFAVRHIPFRGELMTSVTWGGYATALILVGLYRRYAPFRYFGIALFGITILKVFFGDLAGLQQIYRVLSFIGLGVLLLLTSYLYQRMRGAILGGKGPDG
ncbi:MAG TPA: DUF2339 domain-containing protein [Vicinamibacterales bacterium]|nr:DUF2339 domain-containing protein [Vicinamibacterales bacterium]